LKFSQEKVCVNEDDIWEIANSIRWLNQTFKDTFKIEKFIFGEIYPSYFTNFPEFMTSLMEELGYDKEEKVENNENIEEKETFKLDSISPSSIVNKSLATSSESIKLNYPIIKTSFLEIESADTLQNGKKNFTNSFFRVTNIFEEFESKNELENEYDNTIQNVHHNINEEECDELFEDLKRKKM
jgi:hypothetical protein